VKYHLILKLRRGLEADLEIPDWVSFINDKSVVIEHFEPGVDAVMREIGARFWLTREYRPAGPAGWSEDERLLGLSRTYRLIFQQAYVLPPDLVSRVRRVASVEDAHELKIGEAPLPPAEVSTQASVGRRVGDLIQLPYARAVTKGDPAIRIAVLDTGVNLDHPELRGRIVGRADFVDLEGLDTTAFVGDVREYDDVPEDEVGHGTHVSGIIAGLGVEMDEGVAPRCSIVAVRVLATMRQGTRFYGAGIVDNINPAIKWAVDVGRADVINMSLGIKHVGGALPHADVIRYALSRNVAVVAASGNDGKPERYYPGALPGVIAVGAIDDQGRVASFTSYGANITCVAPGTGIYSSFANRRYAYASGTSQASPFVAGGIGLLKSYAREQGGSLSNGQITSIIRHTSDRVDSRLRNEHAGYGVLNLADAFKFLAHSMN
jgi:subtilisin family serine protease